MSEMVAPTVATAVPGPGTACANASPIGIRFSIQENSSSFSASREGCVLIDLNFFRATNLCSPGAAAALPALAIRARQAPLELRRRAPAHQLVIELQIVERVVTLLLLPLR